MLLNCAGDGHAEQFVVTVALQCTIVELVAWDGQMERRMHGSHYWDGGIINSTNMGIKSNNTCVYVMFIEPVESFIVHYPVIIH